MTAADTAQHQLREGGPPGRRRRQQRPGDRRLLLPVSGGTLDRAKERVGPDRVGSHPVVATLVVITGCFLTLAMILIGSGLAFSHFLAHGSIGAWDNHIDSWLVHHRRSLGNRVSGDLTVLGDTLGVVIVAAATTTLLLARRWGRMALMVVIGLAVELAVFLSTTYVVARPRPPVPHLGSTPSTFSWPSGHTAATLVLYCGCALLVMMATPKLLPRLVAWVISVTLVLAVALARIYRGEHHPTDTMAGVVLGVGALLTATVAIRTWGVAVADTRPAETPMPGSPRAQVATLEGSAR